MKIVESNFGLYNDVPVSRYDFTLDDGFCVSITPFGATVIDIKLPTKEGKLESIVMGFDNLDDYLNNPDVYFGSIIGRVAGRIENACFKLEDRIYYLTPNNLNNTLHGGKIGFNQKLFNVEKIESFPNYAYISFAYLSNDLEEGFPGNLMVNVIYRIYHTRKLEIKIIAKTDKLTIVDLTNHMGFNLSGDFKESVGSSYLEINASKFAPLKSNFVPKEMIHVDNQVFDFRKKKRIEEVLSSQDPQILLARGIDHPFLLNQGKHQIVLSDKKTKRKIKITTNQKAVIVYSGNFLKKMKIQNCLYSYQHSSIAFETQNIPNAINSIVLDKPLLHPNDEYHHLTIYEFEY